MTGGAMLEQASGRRHTVLRPLIVFMRHGETEWNRQGRLQGQRDIPLNDTGREQARRNGKQLQAFLADGGLSADAFEFVASPLARARETMEIVREALGLSRAGYRTDERLQEIAFGCFEGATRAELFEDSPELMAAREADKWAWAPPGGESYAMLLARVGAWLDEVDRPSIVAAHGGVMRCLACLIEGIPVSRYFSIPIPQDRFVVWREGRAEWR